METIVILAAACVAAAYLPELVIGWISERYLDEPIKSYYKKHPKHNHDETELKVFPKYMGRIERPLFVLTYYFKYPQFIALWFTIKSAGNWPLWNPTKSEEIHIGRARFMVFMMKSALSIAGAVLMALFAKWVICGYVS